MVLVWEEDSNFPLAYVFSHMLALTSPELFEVLEMKN